MRPKGKLFALLVVFTAIGLVTATGAFTTVQAERTATVDVNGDASALLQIQPADSYPNGDYASTSNDQLTIDFSNDSNGANAGLNTNATTTLDYVFKITNQGTQSVNVTVDDIAHEGSVIDDSNFIIYHGDDPGQTIENAGSASEISPGQTVYIGFKIDLAGTDNTGNWDVTIEITADAESESS